MLQYWLDKMQANGTRFINISPVRNDLSAVPDAEWLAIQPGTDTALLLALSYVLIAESLYDQRLLPAIPSGLPLLRLSVGRARWRSETRRGRRRLPAGRPAHRRLAREMARHRTMVNISGLSSAPVKGSRPTGRRWP